MEEEWSFTRGSRHRWSPPPSLHRKRLQGALLSLVVSVSCFHMERERETFTKGSGENNTDALMSEEVGGLSQTEVRREDLFLKIKKQRCIHAILKKDAGCIFW